MDALNGLTKANWRDFLQSFTDHTIKTGASFDEHRTLALTRIGEVAGKEALDVWKKEEEPTGKFDKCWRGMVGFAAKDPAGAQKWWEALPDGELKKQLVGAMTWGLSQAGEPEVTKFFLAAPDWVQQKVGMDAVKALGVNYGFEASAKFVAAWSAKLNKESEAPRRLFAEVIRQRMAGAAAEGKPEVTCAWLKPHSGKLYLDPGKVKEAAWQWGEKNYAEAFTWAAGFSLGENDQPPSTAIAVAEVWASKELNACMEWLTNHPEVGFNAGVCGLARHLATKDLTEALGWVNVLQDAPLKLRLEAQVRGIATKIKPKGK